MWFFFFFLKIFLWQEQQSKQKRFLKSAEAAVTVELCKHIAKAARRSLDRVLSDEKGTSYLLWTLYLMTKANCVLCPPVAFAHWV